MDFLKSAIGEGRDIVFATVTSLPTVVSGFCGAIAEKVDSTLFDLPPCGRFPKPIYRYGSYVNPWKYLDTPSLFSLFKFMYFTPRDGYVPDRSNDSQSVLHPNLTQFDRNPMSGMKYMWVGHATSLVQLEGLIILTDPHFENSCSPRYGLGPKRYTPTPCKVYDLPEVNIVIISHNHYDNLDESTVKDILRHHRNVTFLVPLGMWSLMKSFGCSLVIELNWWDEWVEPKTGITFACTPSQHWSKRLLTGDTNTMLWCSWCVIGRRNRFCFIGDTAYCPVFRDIGDRYGPFTLANIPIGEYEPRHMFKDVHVCPEEAVEIHKDIKSEMSIGIYWGTFNMGKEHYSEPPSRLRDQNIKKFVTLTPGKILEIGQ